MRYTSRLAKRNMARLASATLIVILLAAVQLRSFVGLGLVAGYVLMSAIAFVAYAADKSAARHRDFRTQESALHLLGLFGGWPGALAAQRIFRHKTVKASFQAAFWMCVVMNIVGLILVVVLASPG